MGYGNTRVPVQELAVVYDVRFVMVVQGTRPGTDHLSFGRISGFSAGRTLSRLLVLQEA